MTASSQPIYQPPMPASEHQGAVGEIFVNSKGQLVPKLYGGVQLPAETKLYTASPRQADQLAKLPQGVAASQADGKWRVLLEFDRHEDAQAAHEWLLSQGVRARSMAQPCDQAGSAALMAQPVGEVLSYKPLEHTAVIKWYPALNGTPPDGFNVGAKLYTQSFGAPLAACRSQDDESDSQAALSLNVEAKEPASTPKPYSQEWFAMKVTESQRRISEWPQAMRENMVVASAELPVTTSVARASGRVKTYPALVPCGGYHRIVEMTAAQMGSTEAELDLLVSGNAWRHR